MAERINWEEAEAAFCDHVREVYGPIELLGAKIDPAEAVRTLDNVAWHTALNEYLDNITKEGDVLVAGCNIE